MSDWRFDMENMPKDTNDKIVEVAYISIEGKPTTAIVGWDGLRWVTCRSKKHDLVLTPPPTIYAWKLADLPPNAP